ncbi:hypothetical protein [Winogradskyella tangerina]|uniref:hypothetical protein n=1 Tax=Winogradskyella tangerina TaxID=2023240 RepID=UPI0018E573F0|nr:hypothetical protein [Winogradskyella tangerina]
MKKIAYILSLIIISSVMMSCDPEPIADEPKTQACCGESGEIPPPPPPPPPTKSGD